MTLPEEAVSSHTPRASDRVALTAALAAAFAAALFMLPWWNRFLGLSLDGYMPWFGHRILQGEVPYRDFFLHLPPLHPLGEAALEALFGRSILAGRLVGVFGHLLMAAIAAAWLARRFRPSLAVFGAVAALAVATADDTEILDLYNPHAALLALASGYFAALALDAGERQQLLAYLSGAAAGLAFWIKQTVGLGAALAVPTALALFALRDRDERPALIRMTLRYAAGWTIAATPIVGWLALNGAFDEFLTQVFADAAGSKGSPWRLFLRPWLAPFELSEIARPATVAALLAIVIALLLRLKPPPIARSRPEAWRSAALGLAAAAVLIVAEPWLIAGLVSDTGGVHALHRIRAARFLGMLLALYGVTALGLSAVAAATRRRLEPSEREVTLFVVVAAAIALSQSLSFAATGAAAFPALALIAAHGSELSRPATKRWLAIPVLAICGLSLVASVSIHQRGAFDFAGWREPSPSEARARAAQPALAGLFLSRGTIRTADGVVAALRRATDPGEPIFTFPVYPLFHWLADRPSATFASLHWIDVTPDHIVDADLARLLDAPPVAVVRQWIPDGVLEVNERYFRNGRESGMRRMQSALDQLLDARYRRVFVAPRRRYGGYPRIEVWVLEERAAARDLPPAD